MTAGPTRRTLLHALPLALAGAWPARATPSWLVTPEEVAAWRQDGETPVFATRQAGAPVIEVLRPTLGPAPVASPLPIELAFRAAAGARIDPASLKVYYGAFRIDITSRLLGHVAVGPEGLKLERAEIPSGSHRLVLQISDDQGRQGTRELRFSVA